ncbi:Uncharacterized conserved protein, DUF2336 family [Pseudovibrio ascidiaceicola]|uniref:Uncharacterized conserved protein, DUF2336 family n=1 Tax=Pseudovibrio ascidiaceicola TaxID=285279 RepID=A0A1I3XTP8_9HYPH|nr:DUF2336 domain-containing protein [Pseudovibrio ascidiaceicola]SFK22366.1 Uncharacterized conserved protein, DUF2336 family [Pseudovibrio ascidiaceicola]
MSSDLASHIVDFNSLALENNIERRSELARHVALLFARTWERCSDDQIDIYDGVMLRLSEMVERHALSYMAEQLSEVRRAPEQTVRKLAFDEIEIAEPLLRNSNVLRESDLVSIARSKSDDHRLAIAKRDVISENISDVLVNLGSTEVKQTVAANDGAVLGQRSVNSLMTDAKGDEVLQLALGQRADLADAHIEALINFASEQVRKLLIKEGATEAAGKLPKAARIAAGKLSNEFWLGRYDFETGRGRVMELVREGKLTENALRAYAEEDRFAEAVAAFAMLAGIGHAEAQHWTVRNDTEPFLVVCRASGFGMMTVQALLKIGPWRYRLSNSQRQAALKSYQALDQQEAYKQFITWKEQWMA